MAQPLLKQLMTQTFDDSPMGYPGDEDNGSMAAWYIFNSLGFILSRLEPVNMLSVCH